MNTNATEKPALSRRSLHIITNSEQKTFKRCVKEHQIAYRLGYRPVRSAAPLRFGTLVHKGLEAWWRAAAARLPTDAWLTEALAAVQDLEMDPFDIVRAEELLLGYHARWGHEIVEVLGVEIQFETALINPETGAASKTFRLGGKIDAIVRLQDGGTYIVEHKTSSEDVSGGSDYLRRLRLDAQVSTYYVGARALGHGVAGCLYDVIAKPKLQPFEPTPEESRKYKKDGTLYANQRDRAETLDQFRTRLRENIASNPDRYFVRGFVIRLEDDEKDAAYDMWQTARAMSDAERLNRFPRNDQACVRWGRTCDYFAACTREASLEDPTRFRLVTSVHEELDKQENAA